MKDIVKSLRPYEFDASVCGDRKGLKLTAEQGAEVLCPIADELEQLRPLNGMEAMSALAGEIANLRAKLTRAVEALEKIRSGDYVAWEVAAEALAEIRGER